VARVSLARWRSLIGIGTLQRTAVTQISDEFLDGRVSIARIFGECPNQQGIEIRRDV
jgi:hypothetical protein